MYWDLCHERREALANGDLEAAKLADEEIQCIGMHTENPMLRSILG